MSILAESVSNKVIGCRTVDTEHAPTLGCAIRLATGPGPHTTSEVIAFAVAHHSAGTAEVRWRSGRSARRFVRGRSAWDKRGHYGGSRWHRRGLHTRLTTRLVDWLFTWLTRRRSAWLAGGLTNWLFTWLTGRGSAGLASGLTQWLLTRLTCRLTNRLFTWLACRSSARLTRGLTNRLAGGLTARRTAGLACRLTKRLL